jgi:hypothetical protein
MERVNGKRGTAMPDGTRIDINRVNGTVVFTTVTVTRSQVVFWHNNDSEAAHWPIQGPRFQIGSSNNSDDLTVYPAPLPTTIYYGCAIPGHENERGSIVVYDDFLPSQIKNNKLDDGKNGTAYPTTNLATGGKSNYTFSITNGSVPPGMTINGTTNNTGITIAGTPTQSGTFTFTLNANDSLQNNIQQTFTVTIN